MLGCLTPAYYQVRCGTKTWSDVVIKSLMKCHITNSMNGIEDEFLFDPDIGSNDKMSDTFPSDNKSNEDFVGFKPN